MLTVAWNLAAKGRLTYNYDLATTGIQPLGTFIYAALAKIIQLLKGDKWIFIRIVTVFNVINLLVFAHILAVISKPYYQQRKFQTMGLFVILLFCYM